MMGEVKIMTAEELIEYCKKAYKENKVLETQILVLYTDYIKERAGSYYIELTDEWHPNYIMTENCTARLETARICHSPYINADVSVCLPSPDFGFNHEFVGFVPLSANPTPEEIQNALSETGAKLIEELPDIAYVDLANTNMHDDHWSRWR